MATKRRSTIHELAELTGVHASTVSRVLNPSTRHLIGAEVADRVLKAAQKLNYTPNRAAASLRTSRSGIIGVMLPDITNPIFPPICRGIEDELAKRGMLPLIANASGSAERKRFVVDQMVGRRVDGLILATAERNDPVLMHCLDEGLPVIGVNRSDESGRVSCVVGDSRLAIRLAVSHLTTLGHRRIAHLSGPTGLSTGHLRKLGFEDSIKEHSLRKSACPIIECPQYSREAGKAACEVLLEKYRDVTAIVAGNDLIALGCYDALRSAGVRCPEDISIVGHNDMPLMDAVAPALTTIHLPLYEMGARAASLILETLQSGSQRQVNVVLTPELVVRASTAAPSAARS
ncbi:transcriptional regulator, LacI family [Paraburkholderia steynii]|uniref:Transcriptional regulator, LacI family n=1 Tax=Paraburkholderia steynii TaxID=1245441 RepID=A0A7Z7FJ83_9BURK|nr:LacI family DNA-binding transcriptional regulator [Paraburkholderia steynii]SDI50342.1 transcriptional regulator, LacI family [Paraburkholderia steynii]